MEAWLTRFATFVLPNEITNSCKKNEFKEIRCRIKDRKTNEKPCSDERKKKA